MSMSVWQRSEYERESHLSAESIIFTQGKLYRV